MGHRVIVNRREQEETLSQQVEKGVVVKRKWILFLPLVALLLLGSSPAHTKILSADENVTAAGETDCAPLQKASFATVCFLCHRGSA